MLWQGVVMRKPPITGHEAKEIRKRADAVGRSWPIIIVSGSQSPVTEGKRSKPGHYVKWCGAWIGAEHSTMRIVVGDMWLAALRCAWLIDRKRWVLRELKVIR